MYQNSAASKNGLPNTYISLPRRVKWLDGYSEIISEDNKRVLVEQLNQFCTFHDMQHQTADINVGTECTFVDEGSYAVVYSDNHSDDVYKAGYVWNNIPYLLFVMETLKAKSSLFPNFKSIDIYTDGDFNTMSFVIKMERLNTIFSYGDDRMHRYVRALDERARGCDGAIGKHAVLIDTIRNAIKSTNDVGGWASVDLHSGNVMIREANHRIQFVCTDPLDPAI